MLKFAVDDGTHARAIGAVQGALDGRNVQAQGGGAVAVQDQVDARTARLQIGIDVGDDIGLARYRGFQAPRFTIQRFGIGAHDGELIGGGRAARPDADGRWNSHERAKARKVRYLRPQAVHDLSHAAGALVGGFQEHVDVGVAARSASGSIAAADVDHEIFDVLLPSQYLSHLALILQHLVVGSPLSGTQVHAQVVAVAFRYESFGHDLEKIERQSNDREEHHRHERTNAQHSVQAPGVEAVHRVETRLVQAIDPVVPLLARVGPEKTAAQHGCKDNRNHAGEQDCHGDGDRELAEQAPQHAAHEQDGNENGGQRHCHRKNGEADFLGAFERCLKGRLARFDMPHDVFQHHDGVVNDEADAQDQSHHRHVVEAEIQQAHHGERAQEGKRQREAGDGGGPEIPQEQKDHAHNQPDGDEHGDLDIAERRADSAGAIAAYLQVSRGRQLLVEHRYQRVHAIGNFQRVGSGLPEDNQSDGSLALLAFRINPGGGLVVLHAVLDVGHFFQVHRPAAALGDHYLAELFGVHQLPVGVDVVGPARAVQRSHRAVHVPLADRRRHFVQADLAGRQFVRIHLHAHCVFLLAAHLHLRDAADHRDAGRDLGLGVVIQLGQRKRVGKQSHERDGLIGGIALAERRRRRHAGGQAAV